LQSGEVRKILLEAAERGGGEKDGGERVFSSVSKILTTFRHLRRKKKKKEEKNVGITGEEKKAITP